MSDKLEFSNQWCSVVTRSYRKPPLDIEKNYTFVRRNNPHGVLVVALDGDQLILTKEFRPPLNDYVISLPAGIIDEAANAEVVTDEMIITAGLRELEEETGYVPVSPEEVVVIGRDLPSSPGIVDEITHFIFAPRVYLGPNKNDEPIQVLRDWKRNKEEWNMLDYLSKKSNMNIDVRVYSALYLTEKYVNNNYWL